MWYARTEAPRRPVDRHHARWPAHIWHARHRLRVRARLLIAGLSPPNWGWTSRRPVGISTAAFMASLQTSLAAPGGIPGAASFFARRLELDPKRGWRSACCVACVYTSALGEGLRRGPIGTASLRPVNSQVRNRPGAPANFRLCAKTGRQQTRQSVTALLPSAAATCLTASRLRKATSRRGPRSDRARIPPPGGQCR